jgi:hypothetical protein
MFLCRGVYSCDVPIVSGFDEFDMKSVTLCLRSWMSHIPVLVWLVYFQSGRLPRLRDLDREHSAMMWGAHFYVGGRKPAVESVTTFRVPSSHFLSFDVACTTLTLNVLKLFHSD